MILSICLTISSWPSDVKLDILEAIDGVVIHTKSYSWARYLADLMKLNYEKCQEKGTPIKLCSLMIWIAMSGMSLINQPEFTNMS